MYILRRLKSKLIVILFCLVALITLYQIFGGVEDERERLWEATEKRLIGRPTAHRLPDVICIGVEKCGTHALFQFMESHPLIRWREPYEAHYFTEPERFKDFDHYRESMPLAEDICIVGEKTPAYFNFLPKEIPTNIRRMIPNVKLIVILCDPVRRVVSDFVHEKVLNNPIIVRMKTIEKYLISYIHHYQRDFNYEPNDKTSAEIMQDLATYYNGHLLSTGFYEHHMYRWMKEFQLDVNLMVIDGERLMKDPGAVIEEVQDYLQIPKLILKKDFVKDPESGFYCYQNHRTEELSCLNPSKTRTRGNSRNESADAASPTNATLELLRDLYRGHQEQLEKLLGRKFLWGKS